MAGGVAAGEIGARWSNRNRGAAEDAGLVIKRNCGLALTDRRLLALDLAIAMMGGVREVKEVLSEVPIDQVDARSMRLRGVEPPRPEGHRHLKPARLPVPPQPRGSRSLA